MGSLFLGVLSGCVARLKDVSRRSEEAFTQGDGSCARARLRIVMPAGARMPLLFLLDSSPRPRCGCPVCLRNLPRHASISRAQVGFSTLVNSQSACWPARVRGEDGAVRAGTASRQCLNSSFAAWFRSRAECRRLCGMLVCRWMRRRFARFRDARLRSGRRTGGRCWREEQQHGHGLARVRGKASREGVWFCMGMHTVRL